MQEAKEDEFLSAEEVEALEKKWEKEFPELPDFLVIYLHDAIYEEMGHGETTSEILHWVIKHRERPYIERVLHELEKFIFLAKKGKIDPEEFIMLFCEKMRDYEDKSDLEWIEDIQKILRENYTKKYGKTA